MTLPTPADRARPTLLVHGLWDSSACLGPLADALTRCGVGPVALCDLRPSDGRASIGDLAEQVGVRVDALLREHGCGQLDLVGFSMGALVCRYYLQRCGGRERTRRLISISGPHRGTLAAFGLPWVGVRQMRPGSALLVDLESDVAPWGEVEVHCIYTPYDLMIVPSSSSCLPGARSVHRVPVPIHRWMLRDRRVTELVARLLASARDLSEPRDSGGPEELHNQCDAALTRTS